MPKRYPANRHEQVTTIGQVSPHGAWHIGDADRTLCGREWRESQLLPRGTDVYMRFRSHRPKCESCAQDYAAYVIPAMWTRKAS